MGFIEKLRERQARQDMTLREFATWLDAEGVDASYLSRLYRGERGVTNNLVLAIMDKAPDLSGDLFSFLRSELPKRDVAAADARTATPKEGAA